MKNPKELLEAAFSKPRTARSSAYKAGVLALLNREIKGKSLKCPYADGTAQADAFWSGIEEGWLLLRKAQREEREGAA